MSDEPAWIPNPEAILKINAINYPIYIERLEAELDRLKSENAALKETNSRLHRRVQAMESKHPERKTILHPDDSAKEINRLNAELRASNEGVKMAAAINNIRLKDNLRLKSELAKANADQWIPVSVRLPDTSPIFEGALLEKSENLLVYTPDWKERTRFGIFYDDFGEHGSEWRIVGCNGKQNVTHWRELPTPPQV
jgi:hypothetical protein